MTTINVDNIDDLDDAWLAASSGDIIVCAAGSYGTWTLSSRTSPGGYVKITSLNKDAIFSRIIVSDADYVWLDNLVANGNNDPPIYVYNGSTFFKITNCLITSTDHLNTAYPIHISYITGGVIIEENEISWCDKLYTDHSENVTITRNYIHDTRNTHVHLSCPKNHTINGNFSHGVHPHEGDHTDHLWIGGTGMENITIENELWLDIGDDDWECGLHWGDPDSDNVLIRNCMVAVFLGEGIAMQYTSGDVVNIYNNTVIKKNAATPNIPLVTVYSPTNVSIHDNLVIHNDVNIDTLGSGSVLAQYDDPEADHYIGDLFVDAMTPNTTNLEIAMNGYLPILGNPDGVGITVGAPRATLQYWIDRLFPTVQHSPATGRKRRLRL